MYMEEMLNYGLNMLYIKEKFNFKIVEGKS